MPGNDHHRCYQLSRSWETSSQQLWSHQNHFSICIGNTIIKHWFRCTLSQRKYHIGNELNTCRRCSCVLKHNKEQTILFVKLSMRDIQQQYSKNKDYLPVWYGSAGLGQMLLNSCNIRSRLPYYISKQYLLYNKEQFKTSKTTVCFWQKVRNKQQMWKLVSMILDWRKMVWTRPFQKWREQITDLKICRVQPYSILSLMRAQMFRKLIKDVHHILSLQINN